MTVIEHDPDEGCPECPMADHDHVAGGEEIWCSVLEVRHYRRRFEAAWPPAPDTCPLRHGPVTVRRKEASDD
jgi:hypothetical protein